MLGPWSAEVGSLALRACDYCLKKCTSCCAFSTCPKQERSSRSHQICAQAAADALGVKIQILTDHLTDGFIEVAPAELRSSKVLRLSFWAEVHYNSLAE
mmetsp:Transcript_30335/g.70553  ORF Transcript_30335/g.70553 Transcript_30335/m.70553 type:complete len:99 (+) Transcript_30335:63-359(+)